MYSLQKVTRSVAKNAATRRGLHTSTSAKKQPEVVIVSAARTPIGSFGGSLAHMKATELGTAAVKAALERGNVKPADVGEVILGNVVSANLGQSPARQVLLGSGIPETTDCTTINKVCASGLKAIVYGAQAIQLGQQEIVVTGGFESMSNIPYYVDGVRFGGLKFGDHKFIDGLQRDGLSDAYNGSAMGVCSDHTARAHNISRADQDAYATRSYNLAIEATKNGYFKNEIISVNGPKARDGTVKTITEDEEPTRVNFAKMAGLRPAFGTDGTATAANSSKMNDGASALVMMSADKASALGLKPLARVLGYSDAALKPIDFPIAPSVSIPRAIANAGLKLSDIDFFEVNEAFSAVALANMKILNIGEDKMNVTGGAVALGHPIGSSGSRIVVTLSHLLQRTGKRYGAAAICNGGGGSSAIVIERL